MNQAVVHFWAWIIATALLIVVAGPIPAFLFMRLYFQALTGLDLY